MKALQTALAAAIAMAAVSTAKADTAIGQDAGAGYGSGSSLTTQDEAATLKNIWTSKLQNCVRVAMGGADIFEKSSSQSYNGYLGHDAMTFLKKADGGVNKADETRVTLMLSKTEDKGAVWIEAASGSGFSTIMNTDKIDFKFNGAAAEIYEGWTFGKLGLLGGSDATKQDITNVEKTVGAVKQSVAACILGGTPRSLQM